MDKTMQEHIEKFNQFVMNIDLQKIPIGLYYGKMGLCIYFYELANLTSDKRYEAYAEKLLDDVISNVTEYTVVDSENGLTGICLGINYLLDKGYVEGNPNKVLKNFDDKIIQSLLFNRSFDDGQKSDLNTLHLRLGSLMYLAIRLQNKMLNRDEKLVIQHVIIENINKIGSSEVDKFSEPTLFSVTDYITPFYLQLLQRVYGLNFYNYKIEKIFEEISPHLLYRYPLHKANRLLLFSAMSGVVKILGDSWGWSEHLETLQQHIHIPQIINDFQNKDVSFSNGLCGFYYLWRKIDQSGEYNGLFLNKIASSDIWAELSGGDDSLERQIGLYGGLSGVILTYLHITHGTSSSFFDSVLAQYV